MCTIPVIDMTKTGQNIVVLRKRAGLSVRDLQDAFVLEHHRRYTSGSKALRYQQLITWWHWQLFWA